MNDVIVAIPTYNERENIADLIRAILAQQGGLDILVIDDNSPDGTGAIVQRIAEERRDVRVIHRDGKRGLGTAYREAFRYAIEHGYAFVVTMDADFSHAPVRIPELVQAALRADVVVGSRYVAGGRIENWPFTRKALSFVANVLARRIAGSEVHDWTSGFRCYRSEVLRSVGFEEVSSEGYSFLVDVLYLCRRKDYKVFEVPIVFVDREFGRTKISRREVYKGVITLSKILWRQIAT